MSDERNHDLHGNAPDYAHTAILLVDVINDLEFPEGEQMLPHAIKMAEAIARLCARARRHAVPVVYVNDNFGKWQSNFHNILEHVLEDGTRGEAIARRIAPGEEDYFVLKPKHSGFYSTTLDTLLSYLGARNLIIGGIATNSCVLFTANDAYMRDYRLFVPRDCSIGHSEEDHRLALALMERTLKADTRPADDIDLSGEDAAT
jgi:nicotinamidase-related amidase